MLPRTHCLPVSLRGVSPKLTAVEVEEYRGVSYAVGGDGDAITLPNILGRYSNVTGPSTGHRLPVTCGVPGASRMCMPHDEEDRLNAAISGSTASALVGQVRGGLRQREPALTHQTTFFQHTSPSHAGMDGRLSTLASGRMTLWACLL